MTTKIFTMALVAAFGLVALPGTAIARPAKCEIVVPDEGSYSGPCDFAVKKGGSFELTFTPGSHDLLGVESLSLTITKPGRGRVTAMYTEGGSEWGVFVRNPKKPACWVNAATYSRICVY